MLDFSFIKNKINLITRRTLVLLAVAGAIATAIAVLSEYLPSFTRMTMYESIPAFSSNQIGIIIEDKPIASEHPPIIFDNEILLPVGFVKDNIDEYIFWDEVQKTLIITNENKVIKMKTDDLTFYMNGKPIKINIPVKLYGDVPYVSITLLKDFYNLDIKYVHETTVVIIDYKDRQHTLANIKSDNAWVRQAATIKSPWLCELQKGKEVYKYGEFNDWTYIRTDLGYLGYVRTIELENIRVQEPVKVEPVPVTIPAIAGKKINLLWKQVFSADSINIKTQTKKPGVNVVSPTWFHIKDAQGTIKNTADRKYVQWAHQNGYKVWALVANPFTDKEATHLALSNSETREKIIRELLMYANLYQLDGINVDFESLDPKTGPYFIQFLRELAPYMKAQGLVLSVDIYVPTAYTAFYNRKEIAKIADYVCVMTYDEHWSTSPVAGSVASADWVEAGVQRTLQEVPKEKLVMGLPFYTRVWAVKDGVLQPKPKAVSMQTAQDLIKQNNATVTWLNDDKQYLAQYTIDGVIYSIWVEDENSIKAKLDIMNKYNLAGVASWKEGMEKDSIWNLIKAELEK